jgi:PAS domain S-box-containing protein
VRGARVTGLAAAVALALALWLAWRVPLVVLRPVRRFADARATSPAVASTCPVPDPGVRELTPLADALTAMRDALRSYRDSALGELHDARALSEATVRCLLDPVVVLDDRGGVALANDAATRAFGLTAGDAETLRRNEIALPAAFVRRATRCSRRARRWRRGASPTRRAGATGAGERWHLVRAAPLREGDGAARRVIVVAEDVTRLRRIDALKSDIVATVSHEFKTPLTSLRMATHLLLEPATGALTDDQREVLTSARDDTERLRALVDELLDLVRIESEAGAPRRVAVEPRRLLERCAEAHRSLAREKGVTLTVLDGDVAAVEVDPERVGIALANLTSNALRHTPAGGRVTLAAEELGDACASPSATPARAWPKGPRAPARPQRAPSGLVAPGRARPRARHRARDRAAARGRPRRAERARVGQRLRAHAAPVGVTKARGAVAQSGSRTARQKPTDATAHTAAVMSHRRRAFAGSPMPPTSAPRTAPIGRPSPVRRKPVIPTRSCARVFRVNSKKIVVRVPHRHGSASAKSAAPSSATFHRAGTLGVDVIAARVARRLGCCPGSRQPSRSASR